ncbi:glycoside hydrolase family 3 protein [Clostridium felsineum]|uniref:Beta-hexosaminidase n=1 Tax=Clostridium felsineum TaxID=36839 RepID=A0A1S8L6S5_9CLOT|nr:glycoside hydrolase family 3 protein [Clostridium felsineum]URZ09728.1 Beta-hexosaminidase [Clostridium felsineum]
MVDIEKLPLDIKIGQMIMAGFPSRVYDSEIEELIKNEKVGNFILFGENLENEHEIVELTSNLQKGINKYIKIPGIISTDQEGGIVTRVKTTSLMFPGNMAFAAAGGARSTFKEGKIVGKELRALGINMNLAPVMDVNCNSRNPVIGTRSYGDNPKKVAEFGVDLIKGLKESLVISVAKHFPGHGDTEVDSHLNLPTVKHKLDRLNRVELFPFRVAIKKGIDAIMSAHVLFEAIEPNRLPSTLSFRVLTGLLRGKLGFEGMIITDCMEMDAIAKVYGSDKAAVMAIKAGADLICISHTAAVQKACIHAIKTAVKNGEISEQRINESVRRILKTKEKYRISESISKNKYNHNNFFIEKISDRSITVLKDDKKLIPLKGKCIFIATKAAALTGAEDKIKEENIFISKAYEKFGGNKFEMQINPNKASINRIVKECTKADRVVIGLYNASNNSGQREIVHEINKVNSNIVLVALRNPYDYLYFKDFSTYINVYDYTSMSVKSVIKVLAGEIKALGVSPIEL